jgi:hypothetical protein
MDLKDRSSGNRTALEIYGTGFKANMRTTRGKHISYQRGYVDNGLSGIKLSTYTP